MGKVLVTGGAGYIGSHTCKALAAGGFTPVVLDDLSTGNRWAVRWGPLELGDVLDACCIDRVIKRHRPIAIMHFAGLALVGESMREPGLYYRNNVMGALNLLEAARTHEICHFVFSSTCATYGTPNVVPIREDTPQRPVNPYGASKLMVERVLADHEMAFGMRYAALRYFNAAGADRDQEIGECRPVETHLIPLTLDAILGLRPPLRIQGIDYATADGTAIRDYISVIDLADAHVAALQHLLAGSESLVLNLGTGRGHSVREVIAAAEQVSGRKVPVTVGPRRPGDPPILVADPTRSLATLGLSLEHSANLESIVATAWAWHAASLAVRRA